MSKGKKHAKPAADDLHDGGGDVDGSRAATTRPVWDESVVASTFAASHAYGGVGAFAVFNVDDDTIGEDAFHRLMTSAAAFVRANADAPAEAIPIHLKLKGFRDLPETGPREIAAWRVFAFTLMQLDRLDAEQAALATASPADAAPPVAAAGDLALMPQPGGFAPTGFTPRR